MSVTSFSFPFGDPIPWYSPEDSKSLPITPLKDWLLATGSLTQKLKLHCSKFEVKVLGEQLTEPFSAEFPSCKGQVWVREVLLLLDDVPWVFARTLIPQSLLEANQHGFAHLGTRPLGELLFTSTDIKPGKIEVAEFTRNCKLAQLAIKLNQNDFQTLWGRRRYFSIGQSELIVSEIFLPCAAAAINQLA